MRSASACWAGSTALIVLGAAGGCADGATLSVGGAGGAGGTSMTTSPVTSTVTSNVAGPTTATGTQTSTASGAICGDGICDPSETCQTCSMDCSCPTTG